MKVEDILKMKDIAVVGISRNPDKPSHYVPRYMLENGYNVIPVNPFTDRLFEKKCYKSLSDVEGNVEIVNIFRPSEEVPEIVRDAILKKVKVIWMQERIENEAAAEEAKKHDIEVVMNTCIMKEHKALYKV
ncbi:MAG: CoA-binding protein [Candidatus Hydrothermarchaeaceae archaeon]